MIAGLQIAFDCKDPRKLSEFYRQLLGFEREKAPPGFASMEEWATARGVPEERWRGRELVSNAIVDPNGRWPRIWFNEMDTPKPGKNRIHLDCFVGNGPLAKLAERKAKVDPVVERALALGATIDERVEDGGYYFVTCLDPEGNEFDIA